MGGLLILFILGMCALAYMWIDLLIQESKDKKSQANYKSLISIDDKNVLIENMTKVDSYIKKIEESEEDSKRSKRHLRDLGNLKEALLSKVRDLEFAEI